MIHTKEPWEIHKGSFVTYILAKDVNGHLVNVASVSPRGVAGCETKGNARLMKVAPKMFRKLEEIAKLMADFEMNKIKRDEIEAILAEARGEGE